MSDFTEIFCAIDDFFKKFEPIYWQFLKQENKRKRIRLATLGNTEKLFRKDIQFVFTKFADI